VTTENLQAEVEGVSQEAYALARAKADGASGELTAQARTLDARLDELLPEVRDASGAIQAAWTDARADLTWVMADGATPTSLRLAAYIRDRPRSDR
jgi:outer membrane murein-binding lipoprotein Lpp